MVTRKVNVKSAEAKSEAAMKAFHKELAGHRARANTSPLEDEISHMRTEDILLEMSLMVAELKRRRM